MLTYLPALVDPKAIDVAVGSPVGEPSVFTLFRSCVGVLFDTSSMSNTFENSWAYRSEADQGCSLCVGSWVHLQVALSDVTVLTIPRSPSHAPNCTPSSKAISVLHAWAQEQERPLHPMNSHHLLSHARARSLDGLVFQGWCPSHHASL